MAQHLAKIFGTEGDKVNCPFYLKMGACRHGDRCSRLHNRPILSQTILLQNMYVAPPQIYDPQTGQPVPQDEEVLQVHFEEFYEDIFEELTNIGGELEQLRVCENLSDHLTGNVYAKFCEEEDAERALKALTVRSPTTAARASRRRRSTMLAGC
jgi:splicing factor U2AF subunit